MNLVRALIISVPGEGVYIITVKLHAMVLISVYNISEHGKGVYNNYQYTWCMLLENVGI